jgi:hypothetical protein
MARFSTGARSAGAGSATLPIGSLYSAATIRPIIREIGVFNTTAVAVALVLRRLTTTGTQGAALTEDEMAPNGSVPAATGFNTHTVTPTGSAVESIGYRCQLGAAVGSGVIWTFGEGLYVPIGVASGVGIVPVGTGQICDFYFVWDE